LASHHPEDVQQIRHGTHFSMTGFPQIDDVIRRAVFRREIVDVPIDAESLSQHAPVVAARVGRVEKLAELAAHSYRQAEGRSFGIQRR